MKNINLRVLLSAICLVSIMAAFSRVQAGPIRFNQVVQILSAQPAKANTGSFTRLHVAGDYTYIVGDDDDDKKKAQTQDGRVITETTTDVVKDDPCQCDIPLEHHGFPKWYLLGLAAIPIAFIIIRHKDHTPTPTPPTTQTPTPTITPTITPTPTVTPTVTPTPVLTPTPTPPQTVPEPMTILLFGTGLASIGLAARRRFGKKRDDEKEDEA